MLKSKKISWGRYELESSHGTYSIESPEFAESKCWRVFKKEISEFDGGFDWKCIGEGFATKRNAIAFLSGC